MRVLVTGHLGYIGTVMVPMLIEAGHEVVGLDSDLYESCTFAAGGAITEVPHIRKDVRDADARDLDGFDAVIHLAALSNDPARQSQSRHDLQHQSPRQRASSPARQGRRSQALFARLVLQQLWLGRRSHGGRNEPAQSGHALWHLQGAVGARHCQARRQRLLPRLPASGHRLRPVAAHPFRHRAQQPGGLGGHHRADLP